MRAYFCTSPDAVDVRTDRSGISVGFPGDHGVTLEGMRNGGAVSIRLYTGHNSNELFHALYLDLQDGIEVEMRPEIGNETNFVIFGHRRVEGPCPVRSRVYLTTNGEWWPVNEHSAKTPKDAMRINLVSILAAMKALGEQ